MDNEKIIDDYNEKSEVEEFDIEVADETKSDEDTASKSQVMPMTMAASAAVDEGFSDAKEYPESPFSYYETNQVNIQLSSGNLQYEVTDFVLPGRDGFDVTIARRYNSGCANLVDMNPDYRKKKIRTDTRDNSHNTQTYGLGYGWSFVLPSIEIVPALDVSVYEILGETFVTALKRSDYILHLEDGRSLNINRYFNHFNNYFLKDVSITSQSGSVYHPRVANMEKSYNIVVEYKNGNKDYFERVTSDFKLVARQDKFGNVICYDLKDYGGMTIVDTWGRELRLEKTDNRLTWKLPGGEAGKKYELFYQLDQTGPLKLTSVTDLAGSVTRYGYYNPDDYRGIMRYSSKKGVGVSTIAATRRYLFLENITYPDNTLTQFKYDESFIIGNEAGGQIQHYAVSMREDLVGNDKYNQAEYSYVLGTTSGYSSHIERAVVKRPRNIEETYRFNTQGLLLEKEIRHQNALISNSVYQYKKKLMVSAVDQVSDRNDKSKVLEKKMSWEYSADDKANILREREEYPEYPECDQEIMMDYGDYSIVTETTRKKGSDVIREKIDLSPESGNRVIQCKQIFENGVLKEKTDYDYGDSKNPYCITGEKQYLLGGISDFIETVYTYDSSKYTHQFVSKEQKGIKDADGNACGSIRETYDYDQWGRIISKTNARGQVCTNHYDKLGRVVKEEQPSISGQPVTNQTYYNDAGNYITKTDANGQKTRIQYTPFGQVSQVCLAAADQPATGDIVLKKFRYNTLGELEEVNTYDGNGTTADCVRKTECYTYDSFGRVLTRSIPQVGYEERYLYNEVFVDPTDGKKYGWEQKTVKGDNSAPDIVTEVYRDQKGQIRMEFLAGIRMVTYEYDNAGNNIRKTDALNKTEQYAYDYAGRVVKTIRTDAGQNRTVRVEYDALGNKRFNWDEAGEKTEFRYDGGAPDPNHSTI